MYCPKKLIDLSNSLVNSPIYSSDWASKLVEIFSFIFFEEYHCQKILKFNQSYADDLMTINQLGMKQFLHKKLSSLFFKIVPFISLSCCIIAILNIFFNLTPQWVPSVTSLIILIIMLIDLLVSKYESRKELKKQENKLIHRNHS